MVEQLEALIAHVNGLICGCADCNRYLKIRELLLAPMGEPEKKPKQLGAKA